MTTNQTKQNAPYGYYELGLRADMLEVELKAACAACTHLHEKLEAAEAERDDWKREYEIAAKSYKQVCVELNGSETELADAKADADHADRVLTRVRGERDALQAKLQAVEALLKKPGCWSEWARECLAVLGGGK